MIQKDFQAFAEAIAKVWHERRLTVIDSSFWALVAEIKKVFANDNPRFDGDRFDAAIDAARKAKQL